MKKTIITIVIFLIFLMTFTFSVCASEGYVKGKGGIETNIKWSVVKEGDDIVARFEIDKTATDKVQTTTVEGYDPETGVLAAYNNPIKNGWGQNAKITKAVIGEGITKLGISLFNQNKTLRVVELPKSLTTLDWSVFEHCTALRTIYLTGNEPEEGTLDLSCIEIFAGYEFHATVPVSLIKKVIFNPNMTGNISPSIFYNQAGITEIEIPAGVAMIKKDSFKATNYIQTFKVLGKDTEFESDAVFSDCTGFPKIVGLIGSNAEKFAKENGYTFVNLETGETVFEGTKPAAKVRETKTDEETKPVDPNPPTSEKELEQFDPTGATAYGHMTGDYNGTSTVDTYWAYYESTQTLKLTSANISYNETGAVSNCDANTPSWSEYKKVIQHIEIGENFHQISFKAFNSMPELLDVRMPSSVSQIGALAFANCSKLTTIWVTGTEKEEGTADFSYIGRELRDSIQGTKIQKIILSGKNTKITLVPPYTLTQIVSPVINDELLTFGETCFVNIIDKNNPAIIHKFYEELDPSYIACGEKCAFGFDEATGTLTVYGVGAMSDIMNYHGGGSKTAPWFDIKQSIKHIVITDNITSIGKYDFAYCKNLETVELPDKTFVLGNAAFEGCENLVSVYRRGTEPIEGTLDLSKIAEIKAWTFNKNYLIANVIFGESISNIGASSFEEAVNLKNVYGVAGSYAATFADEYGFTFYDSSSNTPSPVKCEPPAPETDTTDAITETEPITTEPSTETSGDFETQNIPIFVDEGKNNSDDGGIPVVVVIIAVVSFIAIAAIIIIILAANKKKKNKN